MKGRKANVYITYNGKTIKTALDNFQNSFSYTDPDGGESDSIKINLADPENQWIAAWIPSAGDEIKAEIRTENWNGEGDDGKLDFPSGLYQVRPETHLRKQREVKPGRKRHLKRLHRQ